MSKHTENIDTNDLQPTSTDMLAGLLANTEKIVSSNKRWNYADHIHDKSDHKSDDELDADINDYVNKPNSVFKKDLSDKHDDRSRAHESSSKHHHRDITDTSRDNTENDKDDDGDTTNVSGAGDEKPLSREELMLLKLDMLRKLGELKQCGVHLSQNYNLDSDLKMMQYEYKLHHDIRSKQNSVQWMSHMLIGIIKGSELLNDNYNPFDIKLGGLSDKISSDMHNYYTVLGDIYEKYNQPGKQMAPEMRLLFMISGGALSMQVNRALPGMMGGMAATVKNDNNTLKDLRQKAEADSASMGGKTRDFVKKQHDAAAQKAADLKMIKEKELEYQRMEKMMDAKNGDMKKFKENLILSTESPRFSEKQRDSKPIGRGEPEPEPEDENHNYMTREEIEHIKKMKYREEQEHLEMMRRMAHQKSEMFRNMHSSPDHNERRKRDLDRQNKQLDNILNGISETGHADRKKKKSKGTMSETKPKSKHSKRSSERNRTEDNRSQLSTSSSVSINPDFQNIMNQTFNKAKKDYQKKTVNEPKVQKAPKTSNQGSKAKKKKATSMTSEEGDFRFDKTLKSLLETNDSDLDNISKDEISFGSSDKNKKKTASKNSKKHDKKTNDLVDFGTISFGSKNKGNKMTVNIGHK